MLCNDWHSRLFFNCAGSEYEEDEEGQEYEDDAENDSGRANRRWVMLIPDAPVHNICRVVHALPMHVHSVNNSR